MGLFEKKGIDTIDYTLLQKKGFIKKKVEKEEPYKVNSDGIIELTADNLTSNLTSNSETPASSEVQKTDNVSPFSFLDNIAQASTNSNVQSNNISNNNTNSDEISSVKVKVDDLEYKLERLLEKLAMIESKLDNFEKKVFN